MTSPAPASGAVVFVQGSAAPGSALAAFLAQEPSVTVEQLTFACASSAPTSSAAAAGSSSAPARFERALALLSPQQSSFGAQGFAALARQLAPGATLYVHAQEASAVPQLQSDLLLGGLLDVQAVAGTTLVRGKRPQWEHGAKALLKRPAPAAAAAPAPAAAAQAWKLSAADDDEEMVDEDELLKEEDKQPRLAAVAGASDCSTSRKACKDCSCGRAEAEAAGQKVQLTQDMLDNPTSNCGNCSLGDAFRCSGCPYRGLPAFEPGKKITLPSNFLTADA